MTVCIAFPCLFQFYVLIDIRRESRRTQQGTTSGIPKNNAGGLRLIRKSNVVDSLLHFDIETQWILDFENWERERFLDYSPYENVLDASVFEDHLTYNYPDIFTFNRITGNPELLSYKKEDLDRFYNRVQMQKRLNAVLINRFYNLKLLILRLINLIKDEYHIK